ncbi:MAG: hypothetical protein RI883_1734 [Bacteroidota bacterium]|jgi:hypothetical protein
MSKQIYFSFIIAALSFITVKRIQKAGFEHFYMLETIFNKEDGWFNFLKPDFILDLPFELREISGVTKVNTNEIACVQDENGIIFIYDLESDSIIRQFHFGNNGDYEGIARVDSTFYVLRSDATLIEINSPWDSTNVIETKLNIPNLNNEGLCFDQRTNSLLLAPKSKSGKGSEFKDGRAIYSIDLATKKLNETPLFVISVSEIEAFANEKGIELPQKLSKISADSISALKFMPSELAVHPKTDEIYILSAVDHTMAVFTKNGEIVNFICLDSDLFNKPEGLTFLDNGDLIITNEGQMGVPTLLKFHWLKLKEKN